MEEKKPNPLSLEDESLSELVVSSEQIEQSTPASAEPVDTVSTPELIPPSKSSSAGVREFRANEREQLKEYRQLAADSAFGKLLRKTTVYVSCFLIFASVTQNFVGQIPYAAALVILSVVAHIWFVRARAMKLTKTSYFLSDDLLKGTGPTNQSDLRVELSKIVRATFLDRSSKKKDLILSTNARTLVLRGLTNPEELWLSLPEEVRVDRTELTEKLQRFADSMQDCKGADEVDVFRNTKKLKQRLEEETKEFPDVRVLTPDFIHFKTVTLRPFLVICAAAAFIPFGKSTALLPVVAYLVLGSYLPEIRSIWRTYYNIYIFSADALYEFDRKHGIVRPISLDRISFQPGISGKYKDSLYIDDNTHIPASFEKEEAEFMISCLKNYPNNWRK